MAAEGLVVWTEKELGDITAKAKQLVEEPDIQGAYVAYEFFELAVLLGEAAKRVLIEAGQTPKVNDAVKLYRVGQKLSGQWLDVMTPVFRRRQEKDGRKAKPVSGPRGRGDGSGPSRRGGERELRPDTDAGSPGSSGTLEG